ncbi:MAG: hypothetical protein AseanaTS_14650, partial [Candidatus Pelagadaptatus aseana]
RSDGYRQSGYPDPGYDARGRE